MPSFGHFSFGQFLFWPIYLLASVVGWGVSVWWVMGGWVGGWVAQPQLPPPDPLRRTAQIFAVFPSSSSIFAFSSLEPPGFHTTARELQTCTFEGPSPSNTTREDPRERKKRAIMGAGEGNEILGPTHLREPNLRAPTSSGPHPSGPHPVGPDPSGPYFFHLWVPTPLCPHPFGPPTLRAPALGAPTVLRWCGGWCGVVWCGGWWVVGDGWVMGEWWVGRKLAKRGNGQKWNGPKEELAKRELAKSGICQKGTGQMKKNIGQNRNWPKEGAPCGPGPLFFVSIFVSKSTLSLDVVNLIEHIRHQLQS